MPFSLSTSKVLLELINKQGHLLKGVDHPYTICVSNSTMTGAYTAQIDTKSVCTLANSIAVIVKPNIWHDNELVIKHKDWHSG